MLLLLSGAKSRGFGDKTAPLLESDAKTKPESMGLGVASAVLRSSLVHTNSEGTFIAEVWRYCSEAFKSDDVSSTLRDFLLVILLHTMPSEESRMSSYIPPGTIFDLWADVARDLTSKVAVEFCVRLEHCLAETFNDVNGQGSWAIYQRVCKLTPPDFVDLWLNVMMKRDGSSNGGRSCLLLSVLGYDCSEFSCVSSMLASINTDENVASLWDAGRLDKVAATFVLQAFKHESGNERVVNPSFSKVASIISKRFLALLSQKVSHFHGSELSPMHHNLWVDHSYRFLDYRHLLLDLWTMGLLSM